MRQSVFQIYVIQIGKNETVLAVNFATDVERAFADFLHKHPHIRDSKLRPDLYSAIPAAKSVTLALARSRELVRELEAVGYEVIAGSPLHQSEWRLYVIEINGNPKHVYVGQTNYPIEKRFQQHIYKYHSARALSRSDILILREDLCAHLPPSYTQEASLKAEKELAERLKKEGYRVEGGT